MKKRKKNIFVKEKQEKNIKKVYIKIKHSVHWGINPPLSCQAPPP